MIRSTRLPAALAATCAAALTLSACGGSSTSESSGGASGHKVKTVASFYPLEYALQQIGGDKISVSDLTKAGVEPHDLDLSPQQVASVGSSDLTVYVKGFQKSVDDAVGTAGDKNKIADVSQPADLSLKLSQTETVGEQEEEGDAHASDPHFWLDPVRYKAVVKAINDKLKQVDSKNASTYQANTDKLVKQLDELDGEYRSGLSSCKDKTIVTGHAAFGYLAQRYGMKQVGVSGVSPEEEPTPQRLKDVSAFIKSHGVKTVYSETLVSPKTAQTVASQTGTTVKVLDPIEGITSASNGKNYLEVMRSNLATLKQGQNCK